MATANERRALWFLAAVALSGSVVRIVRSRAPELLADPALQRQISRIDSVRGARKPKTEGSKPKAEGPKPKPESTVVDINSADSAAIEALPGIGPALAARIISARDSTHGFRDLTGLCAVRGVGAALIERLRPRLTVYGTRADEKVRCPESPSRRSKSR